MRKWFKRYRARPIAKIEIQTLMADRFGIKAHGRLTDGWPQVGVTYVLIEEVK